jgi:hypothetical protein
MNALWSRMRPPGLVVEGAGERPADTRDIRGCYRRLTSLHRVIGPMRMDVKVLVLGEQVAQDNL